MIAEAVSTVPPTRREARRLNRHEAILDVAAQSFLENGYAATTMNAIAATLGGSKATLWSYFPSKDVLFAAVLDRATSTFRQQLALILNPDDPPEQALRRFCHGFIERITSPDAIALNRLVIGEVQRFPEIGRIFFERAPEMTRQLLARYLADVMAMGLLRQDDPMVAAAQLTALCHAGSHHRLLLALTEASCPMQIRTDTDHAMDIFMRAYAV